MLIAKYSRGEEDPSRPSGEDPGGSAQLWAAPHRSEPLDAVVNIPSSKSLMGRELVLSALADGPSIMVAPLESRDSTLMIEALRSLGTSFETVAPGPDAPPGELPRLVVTPASELLGSTSIACGLAGTVMRFVPPIAALALGPTAFDGDTYARKRPMRGILDALRLLGVDIADEGRGALPFTVHGSGSVQGGRVEVDASLSSQFVSGLLLSAPRFEEGVHVVHIGDQLPSVPHIEMTMATLRGRGVQTYSPAEGEWVVEPGPIQGREIRIEPDLSNAAPFLAAALAAGGSVTVPGWPSETTQVGDRLRSLLPEFGATVSLDGDALTVTSDGSIRGVELHVPEAGELAPTLIGLAALADSPSTITGIGHIRHHETDRIAALIAEIRGLGGDIEELDDGVTVRPAPLHEGTWRSYADHRMATTGAVIGLRVEGVQVEDVETTAKTMPQFTNMWLSMLGQSAAAPGAPSQ